MYTGYSLVEYVFTHDHECAYKDLKYNYRPICNQGVALLHKVTCVETGAELTLVEVKKI